MNFFMMTASWAPTKGFSISTTHMETFPSVASAVRDKWGFVPECFSTFTTYKTLSSSVNSLVHRYVLGVAGFLAFPQSVMTFSALYRCFPLCALVWLLHFMGVLLLLRTWAGQAVLLNLAIDKACPWHVDSAALHKWGPAQSITEGFLSHMLFLVLVTLCTEMKSFCTCPAPQQCRAVLFALLLYQVKNVSQDRLTIRTGVTLLGRRSCLGILGLCDLYTNILFNRCLHILSSTAATWMQRNAGEVPIDYKEQRTPAHMSTCHRKARIQEIFFKMRKFHWRTGWLWCIIGLLRSQYNGNLSRGRILGQGMTHRREAGLTMHFLCQKLPVYPSLLLTLGWVEHTYKPITVPLQDISCCTRSIYRFVSVWANNTWVPMFKSTTERGVRERVKCGINGGGNICELETPGEVTSSRTDKSAKYQSWKR